jgi:hypothetical protein
MPLFLSLFRHFAIILPLYFISLFRLLIWYYYFHYFHYFRFDFIDYIIYYWWYHWLATFS